MCVLAGGQGSLSEAGTRETDKKQLLGEEGSGWWEGGTQDGLAEARLLLAETRQAGHCKLDPNLRPA